MKVKKHELHIKLISRRNVLFFMVSVFTKEKLLKF